jgi:hypothetical protein
VLTASKETGVASGNSSPSAPTTSRRAAVVRSRGASGWWRRSSDTSTSASFALAERAGFYPQPRYGAFEREPGRVYRLYATSSAVDALADAPNALLYEPDAFAAAVTSPHLELKLVARSARVYRSVAGARAHDERLVAWFRRPLQFARSLYAFPWRVRDELVLFDADSNEPAFEATLRTYVTAPDGSFATGYLVLDIRRERPATAGVAEERARVFGARTH